MTPYRYYKYRRQTLVNWLDLHTHMRNEFGRCHYCNRSGDELWWYLPTCRAQAWHIRNMNKPGGPRAFGQCAEHTDNPYRKRL